MAAGSSRRAMASPQCSRTTWGWQVQLLFVNAATPVAAAIVKAGSASHVEPCYLLLAVLTVCIPIVRYILHKLIFQVGAFILLGRPCTVHIPCICPMQWR